jgi:hypothetical protein
MIKDGINELKNETYDKKDDDAPLSIYKIKIDTEQI